MESLFNKVAGWMSATLLKWDSTTGVFCEIYKTFMNTFLHRTPLAAASEFDFGEEQIYIHTLVLKVLRLQLMRNFEST